MSSSNCCFLTCIQVSQEAGQVVWYSHLFQSFPQFIVIHTVQGFERVNKAEVDVFLELSCFCNDLADVGNLISGSSAFSKSSLNIWKFMVHVSLKPGLENFEYYFTSMWDDLAFQKISGETILITGRCLSQLFSEWEHRNNSRIMKCYPFFHIPDNINWLFNFSSGSWSCFTYFTAFLNTRFHLHNY